MKKSFFLLAVCFFTCFSLTGQLKKDGTPDMRFKANKELYGNSFQSPASTYRNSDSEPANNQSFYSEPIRSNTEAKQKNYENGGQLYLQNGYFRSNGTYVEPHIKTKSDNQTWNNYNSLFKTKN